MNIEKIINELSNKWAILLRGKKEDFDNLWNSDIDFFLPKEKINEIKEYLYELWFCLIKKDNSFYHYKYYDFKTNIIYFFDFTLNFDNIFNYFNNIEFKTNFIQKYLKNPKKYNLQFSSIRYLFMFKNNCKHKSFFINNWEKLEKNDFYLDNINNNIFKKGIEKKDIKKFLSRNIFTLFKYLKFKYCLNYYLTRLKEKYTRFNSWKIIIFFWVDWVWKTTIAHTIEKMSWWKYIYMSSRDLILEKLYKKMQSNNKIIQLIKFLMIYIENWIKLWIILYYKIMWYLVILDRYPRLQYFNSETKNNFILNNIFYKYLFFTPKSIFVLYEKAEEIHKRKQEVSIKEIKKFYKDLKKYLKKEKINSIWIKNEDINKTCQIVFNEINNEIVPKNNLY